MVTVALVNAGGLNVLLVHGGPFGKMGVARRECLYAACWGGLSKARFKKGETEVHFQFTSIGGFPHRDFKLTNGPIVKFSGC